MTKHGEIRRLRFLKSRVIRGERDNLCEVLFDRYGMVDASLEADLFKSLGQICDYASWAEEFDINWYRRWRFVNDQPKCWKKWHAARGHANPTQKNYEKRTVKAINALIKARE